MIMDWRGPQITNLPDIYSAGGWGCGREEGGRESNAGGSHCCDPPTHWALPTCPGLPGLPHFHAESWEALCPGRPGLLLFLLGTAPLCSPWAPQQVIPHSFHPPVPTCLVLNCTAALQVWHPRQCPAGCSSLSALNTEMSFIRRTLSN
jgi:hypothetical protein